MANNRRRQGGGGGGGGDDKITLMAGFNGKRDNCKIVVVLRRGRFGLPGERVMFRFGTKDQPYGPWLMDADPTNAVNRLVLTTENSGEIEGEPLDLSDEDWDKYTQLLAVYNRNTDPGQGIYEQAFQLPAVETGEGLKAQAKTKAVTLEVIMPYCANADGSFLVTVKTKKGDKAQGNVEFTLSGPEALTATAPNLVVLGQGLSFELETAANGELTFVLTFGNPVQTQGTFSLPGGSSVTKTFVKLPQ